MAMTQPSTPRGGAAETEQPQAAPAPASGLHVERIGKAYGKRPVVKGVSASLQRGEIVGLLGPNGAGKTTCFYMITGLIAPDYGRIFLDGEDISRLPMYQRARLGIGYLPQDKSIFRGLTVEENIMAVAEIVEKDRKKRRELVDQLLEDLRISHLRDALAPKCSGGEQRRLEIARALATRPSFMLLDEPFAGVDPLAVSDIRDLILFLKERGIGILITDHNVRETLEITDRAMIIHEGEVLFEGTPEEIRADADVRRVYLGESFR